MDGFGWMWNDLPTRVAAVGVLVYAAVILALVWWAGHHYVRSAASSWQWTTWEEAMDAEGSDIGRDSVDPLEWQR